ncbi:hypothetical protein B0T22DRAFT_520289 [Podospora appendiculata]|uniref:C2H2-type domain-containing protein n=1 Tax=Podospora appendiculata TaxID=314037 RepID=A0AAE1C9B4_9PEZI|nr:hypothetical protein B0T22DRAFT_520289 [Podospora appendiculata]
MCDLSLDEFERSDAFSFGGQSFECPPPSTQSSSSTSPTYGPFTPSSGQSTPPRSNSMDFSSSFASSADSFAYDLTPPSSAMSAYFPMDLRMGNCADFLQTGIPITPLRNQAEFSGLPYSSCGDQLAASQAIEFYSYTNALGPSPFVFTPMQSAQPGDSWETWSTWPQAEDSPVSFEFGKPCSSIPSTLRSSTTVKQETTPFLSGLSDISRRRLFTEEAKQKTAALQKVQRDPNRARIKAKKRQGLYTETGIPLKTVPARGFMCDYPGCTTGKKYQRKEHMKRHQKAHHGTQSENQFKCEFCDKVFNRTDNRTQHMRLHANSNRKAPRVQVVEGAKEVLEEQMKTVKTRRPAKARAKAIN